MTAKRNQANEGSSKTSANLLPGVTAMKLARVCRFLGTWKPDESSEETIPGRLGPLVARSVMAAPGDDARHPRLIGQESVNSEEWCSDLVPTDVYPDSTENKRMGKNLVKIRTHRARLFHQCETKRQGLTDGSETLSIFSTQLSKQAQGN